MRCWIAVLLLGPILVGCGSVNGSSSHVADDSLSRATGHPAPSRLTSAEVEELTSLGPHASGWDDPRVEQAWKQKWGVSDIATVSDALRHAAERFPAKDAGLTYDPTTLTYTQWLAVGPGDGKSLRNAVKVAFDRAAHDSNLAVEFASATTPQAAYETLLGQLMTAARSDANWPDGLSLSGDWSPERGAFVLVAGERASDEAVRAYFERRWPGLVILSPQSPPVPQ